VVALALAACLAGTSCGGDPTPPEPASGGERGTWALALHGGAGALPALTAAEEQGYRQVLERALRAGSALLAGGGRALDAVELVVVQLEDDPRFNAGKGAVFNHAGGHELDAAIMEGRGLACGAVAGVSTVKNPVRLARRVMERSRHVLLAGAGAEAFADEQADIERVDPAYFSTEQRRRELEAARAVPAAPGTVGAVAIDRNGDLAAATSTGGLTGKRFGRIGDSPIVGAGTYADNASCAVSGTGIGEEFIRHGVAAAIAWRIGREGIGVGEAARQVVHEVLRPGDGGVIAVDARGTIAMEFSTATMVRAAADSKGRFEVHVRD
jgi:beta-aspartyl-peptidase (threonine type)